MSLFDLSSSASQLALSTVIPPVLNSGTANMTTWDGHPEVGYASSRVNSLAYRSKLPINSETVGCCATGRLSFQSMPYRRWLTCVRQSLLSLYVT